MGALEFEPCLAEKHLNVTSNIEIDQLQELAQDALTARDQLNVENQGLPWTGVVKPDWLNHTDP